MEWINVDVYCSVCIILYVCAWDGLMRAMLTSSCVTIADVDDGVRTEWSKRSLRRRIWAQAAGVETAADL